tara:strand:+ start:1800 stop:2177 length:378 start_codon:yes stop_codon:yes gene_type:complete
MSRQEFLAYKNASNKPEAVTALLGVPISASTTTSATTSAAVTISNSGQVGVALNTARKGVILSVVGTGAIYIRLYAAATDNTRKGIYLPANSTIELFSGGAIYTGEISVVNAVADATPALFATEF